MFCKECSRNIGTMRRCPFCGYVQDGRPAIFTDEEPGSRQTFVPADAKSRTVAGFLQIFTGAIGLGRFYLGYKSLGALQIIVSMITCGIGGLIWGMVDGIRMLRGEPATDAAGTPLKP